MINLKIEKVKSIPSEKLDENQNEDDESDRSNEEENILMHQTFQERIHIPFYYHGDGYLPHFDKDTSTLGKWDNNLKYFQDNQAENRLIDLDQWVRGTFVSQP